MHSLAGLQSTQFLFTYIGHCFPLEGICVNISINVLQIVFRAGGFDNSYIRIGNTVVNFRAKHNIFRVVQQKLLYLLLTIFGP